MADEPNKPSDSSAPFRESGSGDTYNPQGNWGAERRTPTGAGDGGFGPEGDYAGKGGDANAEVIGQVNGDGLKDDGNRNPK